jgi:hypothetical protein
MIFSYNDRYYHLPKNWHFLVNHSVFGRRRPWYRIFLCNLIGHGNFIAHKARIRRDVYQNFGVHRNNTNPKRDCTARDKNPCNLRANGRRLAEMRTKYFIPETYKRLVDQTFVLRFHSLWKWQQRWWQHGCRTKVGHKSSVKFACSTVMCYTHTELVMSKQT